MPSCSIVERRQANVLMTKKTTTYVLEGKLNFSLASEGGLPTFIIVAFKDGFPENWETYRKQWITFKQQQASNDSNMSTVSSLGNVSHFVQKPKQTQLKSANGAGIQMTKMSSPEQDGRKSPTKPSQNLRSESTFSSPTPLRRSNQKDEKLVCQECGKLYKMRKHYQNHLETKHGSKHQTKSQRTDDMHQQRKKRSGRNCASKAMNAEDESGIAPAKKRRGRPPKNRPLDARDRTRHGDDNMKPDKCSPTKWHRRRPKNRPPEDAEHRKQSKQQQRQRQARQKRSMVDVSHESDNGAGSSDDFVPGKALGKGTKPPKNSAPRGRGRPRKILMAAALPPDRAEVLQRRQMEKKREVAPAKADKKPASKPRKTATISRQQKSLSTVAHPSQLPERLVSNPRTVAERRDNSRILQGLNFGHNDDIFNRGAQWQSTSAEPTKKTSVNGSKKLADGILNELFDSDSENDLSVHSSRTPIGKYLERGTKTPIPDSDDHHLDLEDRDVGGEGKSGFMATAYIHRKIEEKRKTERRRTKHKLHSLTSKGPELFVDAPGNPENRIIEEESRPPMKSIMKRRVTEIRLEEPISKIMHQMESSQKSEDGSTSSDEIDEYFSDGKESNDYSEIRAISKKIAAGSRDCDQIHL